MSTICRFISSQSQRDLNESSWIFLAFLIFLLFFKHTWLIQLEFVLFKTFDWRLIIRENQRELSNSSWIFLFTLANLSSKIITIGSKRKIFYHIGSWRRQQVTRGQKTKEKKIKEFDKWGQNLRRLSIFRKINEKWIFLFCLESSGAIMFRKLPIGLATSSTYPVWIFFHPCFRMKGGNWTEPITIKKDGSLQEM